MAEKFSLDVSGKDRLAISVMHAYITARGHDPWDAPTNNERRADDIRDFAQELADNPDESLSTGSLVPDCFHRRHDLSQVHDVVAMIVKYKPPSI